MNSDFARIGIISTDGETIKSVKLVSVFKQQKQTEFSLANVVPDGGMTLALLGMALTAVATLRRKLSC